MASKYGYLHFYVPKKYPKLYNRSSNAKSWNLFGPVSDDEIEEAESLMGIEFPNQLKGFYKEVGDGYLTTPHSADDQYRFYGGANEILPPLVVAHFYLGIIAYHEKPFEDALQYEDHYLANYILEDLEPGDMPFFEISDSSSFMVMKTKSDNSNAVWFMGFETIEDSLEKFIWNLYYKGPDYYNEKW